jgi:hypothetical protein
MSFCRGAAALARGFAALVCLALPLRATAAATITGASLTLESPADVALVEEVREVELTAGANEREISGFPPALDPSSLHVGFEGKGAPRTEEWRWRPPLSSAPDLLAAAQGKPVRADVAAAGELRSFAGVLLSASQGQLVLRDEGGVLHFLPHYEHLEFAAPVTEASVLWRGNAERAGRYPLRLRYEVGPISWSAEYRLTLEPGASANRGSLDCEAAIRIENRAGTSFTQARGLLLAGSARRAPASGVRARARAGKTFASSETALASTVEPAQAAGETYTYPLARSLDLADGTVVVLPWQEARGVPYEQEFLYRGQASDWGFPGTGVVLEQQAGIEAPKHAEVVLRFRNARRHGLGEPLPAGRVRIGTRTQGHWVLLAEASLPHTPTEEEIRLSLGEAFDVLGERRQLDYQLDAGQRRLEETIEIVLRNRKTAPVEVRVREALYRASNWQIVEASARYEKADARTVEFVLPIGSGEEARVRYQVRYSW